MVSTPVEEAPDGADASRPGTALVVPVWGPVHVARFLDLALPTWLPAGNLPALAAETGLVVIIATTREGRAQCEAHPALGLLQRTATVEWLPIDDLVDGGIPSVTLSLAFTRGATAARRAVRPVDGKARIVFLNADFLLADGSLRSVERALADGVDILLAPSLRANEEDVLPVLLRAIDGHVLTLSPRRAVALALENLHPTVQACRADQDLVHSAHPNQFFWRDGTGALLCRSLLLFPLAVAASRDPGPVDRFCDHAWIDTLAPGGRLATMDDSDSYFALELAPRAQESRFVQSGPLRVDAAARGISVWATAFSRRQIDMPVSYRSSSGALPSDALVAASARFASDLLARLREPVRPAWHPYWTSATVAWTAARLASGRAFPPELAMRTDPGAGDVRLRHGVRARAAALLGGSPGRRLPWHPFFAWERELAGVAGDLGVETGRAIRPTSAEPSGGVALGEGWLVVGRGADDDTIAAAASAFAAEVTRRGRGLVCLVADPQSGPLDAVSRLRLLGALDREASVERTRVLMTSTEAWALQQNIRLAQEGHLTTPLRSVGLMARCAIGMAAVLAANLLRRDRRPAPACAIALQVRRRGPAEHPTDDASRAGARGD